MFKLGIVGHPDTLQTVGKLVDEYFDDVEVLSVQFGNDAVMSDVINQIAELQTRCQGILYSRKDPYLLVSSQLHHTVPVRYVDIDSSHLLISVLAAHVKYGFVPSEISVDSFDSVTVRSALDSVGIASKRVQVRVVAFPEGQEGLVDATLQQHICNHEAGSDLCITNVTDVYQSLLALDVPATLISPTTESFVHEIRNLMLRHQIRTKNTTSLAIVHIRLQYKSKYRYYGTMPIREVDDLSRAAKLIAVFAEEVDSAMFQLSRWEYLILCSWPLLENATDRFTDISLMQNIDLETTFDAAIGIGFGQTVKEAETNALSAVSETQTVTGTHAMVVTGEGAPLGPIKPRSERHPDQNMTEIRLEDIASATGLSIQILHRLYAVTRARNTSLFTSSQLASHLEISTRTANRITRKLLAHGYAAVEGKNLSQPHGRPARIIRLRL